MSKAVGQSSQSLRVEALNLWYVDLTPPLFASPNSRGRKPPLQDANPILSSLKFFRVLVGACGHLLFRLAYRTRIIDVDVGEGRSNSSRI